MYLLTAAPPDLLYATGDQWRNNSRKDEGMEPKQKQHPVVDVTGDRSKVRCYKEPYCIGTWNVRSMNQGKMEVGKQRKQCQTLLFWAPKSLQMVTAATKLKDVYSLEEKL